MQVHYLNHEQYQPSDTKLATQYASKLMREDDALNIVPFLVYTKHQYEPFWDEMGFKHNDYKSHGYRFS